MQEILTVATNSPFVPGNELIQAMYLNYLALCFHLPHSVVLFRS